MSGLDFKILGADKAMADISGTIAAYPKVVGRACVKGAHIIEREAKLRAPVDTGALRGSISVDPIPMGADVGPHVDYGAYVEFGTVNTPAQPYLVPAADATRSQVCEIVRREIAGGKW